jgi:ABC-type antimicrobial peptide transport system permease subunit
VAGVAIVNESFARVYFDGRNPVGQRVVAASSNALVEIVGLVTDTAYYSVREDNHPVVYIPLEQRYGATILVRTTENAADLPQVLRRELTRIQPEIQVRDTAPFEAFVTQQLIRERLLAALSTFFAALALVLAIIGMYGVLNYAVTRERREIGLRMVLGARPTHVVTLVTLPLLLAVGCGAAVGSGAGIAFGRVVHTLLFQIGPSDPVALGTPIVALIAAALLAVLPPTVRAARIDPAQTIRNDG